MRSKEQKDKKNDRDKKIMNWKKFTGSILEKL